jgi:hypothetical protein
VPDGSAKSWRPRGCPFRGPVFRHNSGLTTYEAKAQPTGGVTEA